VHFGGVNAEMSSEMAEQHLQQVRDTVARLP
jgi:hypothetical protein